MPYRTWLTLIAALLLTTALTLVAALAFAIHLVRIPTYPVDMQDPSLLVQESPFLMRNHPCDVLVYGDSTASIGVDPRVLTAQTGLSACNIAATRPIVDDLGTLPVDAYLAHNPAPKVIVLQFGPELFFRGQNWEHNGPYAPMVMLARDVPTAHAAAVMLAHPAETTQFLFFILRHRLLPDHEDQTLKHQRFTEDTALLNQSHGLLQLHYPPTTTCLTTPVVLHGPLDTAWIQSLRAHYQTAQTHLILRAAPVPDCDIQLAFFHQALAPYLDQNVVGLPIASFLHDDRHSSPAGAHLASLKLAEAIESSLQIPANSPH